jgi:hypothetical protein
MKFKRKSFEKVDSKKKRVVTKFLWVPKTLPLGELTDERLAESFLVCFSGIRLYSGKRETRWLSKEKIIQSRFFDGWVDEGWFDSTLLQDLPEDLVEVNPFSGRLILKKTLGGNNEN